VRLSNGNQGFVTSVGAGGSSFTVKVGNVRMRDGVEVLESVSKNAAEDTFKAGDMDVVKPEKKEHIIVISEQDASVSKGETGQLISVDGVDGVIRLNRTGDVVILDMACLAKYWQE